ncbi:MAG: glycoside hydrolase [Ignavibacteria bacterium]|nr:glycoside hydrolase [Ignavibacteria bacterium]
MTKNVVLYTSAMEDAYSEIISAGGRVPLQLPDKVLVAALPDDFNLSELKFSSTEKPGTLDENSEAFVIAWNRISEKSSSASVSSEGKRMMADTEPPTQTTDDSNKPAETSQSMNGKIAVGVLVISGPQADNVNITIDEYYKVLTEVAEGNTFLATACYEANITFVLTSFYITISASPQPNLDCTASLDNSRACEAVFRNPALQAIGFDPSYDGVVALVKSLMAANTTNWGYVSFFSKYPMQGDGYAYGVNTYMNLTKWDEMSEVYVHEVCHVFGAADEYDEPPVVCGCGNYGTYPTPNNNCAACPYTPKVPCLMEHFWEKYLCNWSRGQIGWGYWNLPFKAVSNYTSDFSPSIASSSSLLYLAYNSHKDDNIYLTTSQTGSSWTPYVIAKDSRGIAFNAADTPCLIYANSMLFLAWRGATTSKVRTAYSSNNGTSWTKNETEFDAGVAPVITIFNTLLFAAWRGNSNANIELAYSSNNGKTWTGVTLTYATPYSPAIISFASQFYLAWVDSTDYINIAYSSNATSNWTNIKTNFKTNAAPALAVFKNRLYLAYKDFGTATVYYGSSADGRTWGQKLTSIDSPTTTLAGVSMVGFDNKLSNNSNNLYMVLTPSTSSPIMTDNFIPGAI